MEFHKFIHDESQVKKFISILAPLKGDEQYFVSMSARNKYLTDEERKFYGLGRTEMFARKLVKKTNRNDMTIEQLYMRTLKMMQVSEGGYTSRDGKNLPTKCMVVYANVNPVSGFKALKEFQSKISSLIFDTCTDPSAILRVQTLDTLLMNCYQRARSVKYLIDIDFDMPDEGIDVLVKFIKQIKEREVEHHIIKTRSGFHVLMKRDTLKFNYTELVKEANKKAVGRFGKDHIEVAINTNEMVPVPGTMQADFPVQFIEI